ncbi:MAG TPA: hypothetical protein VJZ06_03310 [Mobilitalea sp.]|nr:hypothetical protein [Mobilitalea sp.]
MRNTNKEQSDEIHANRQRKISAMLYIGVTLSFIVPIVFLILRMFTGNVPQNEAGYHSRADYILMIVACVEGLIVINIPILLSKKFRFELPRVLYTLYIIYLFCAIFLGEVRSFFYVIPHWDVILHAFSSLMLGFFGLMVIAILNRDEHLVRKLSPFFAVLFSFCFAVTIGVLWEIYEFTFDGTLGLNMQKFMTSDGVALSGHAALADTMKDIIVNALGALVASVIGYFSIKNDKLWFVPVLRKKDAKR